MYTCTQLLSYDLHAPQSPQDLILTATGCKHAGTARSYASRDTMAEDYTLSLHVNIIEKSTQKPGHAAF